MFKWLHHLLNPHCEDCRNEHDDHNHCRSCETLNRQLAIVNHEKQQLLESLLTRTMTESTIGMPQVVESDIKVPEQISKHGMPWRVRQQMLERDDREKARVLAIKKAELEANRLAKPLEKNSVSTIDELEKELLPEMEIKNA